MRAWSRQKLTAGLFSFALLFTVNGLDVTITKEQFNFNLAQYDDVYIGPFRSATHNLWSLAEFYPIEPHEQDVFPNALPENAIRVRDRIKAAAVAIGVAKALAGNKILAQKDDDDDVALSDEEAELVQLHTVLVNFMGVVKDFKSEDVLTNWRVWEPVTLNPKNLNGMNVWTSIYSLRVNVHKWIRPSAEGGARNSVVWLFTGRLDTETGLWTLRVGDAQFRRNAMKDLVRELEIMIQDVDEYLETLAGMAGTVAAAGDEIVEAVDKVVLLVDNVKIMVGVYLDLLKTIEQSMEGMIDAYTFQRDD
ncbi:hypothetical protein H072_280 [Dactylellina haptotyla CBS 200.50]|uniref:Uncharacterized protein n=1 Tax=Dactylellina haptotyla (strain CBS 200.50) TaxID=1284197 RepID=S8CDN9_DACHA|nr:hypothetical protein H072_280 [Dactylellina haptotyla CBS 200.50]